MWVGNVCGLKWNDNECMWNAGNMMICMCTVFGRKVDVWVCELGCESMWFGWKVKGEVTAMVVVVISEMYGYGYDKW